MSEGLYTYLPQWHLQEKNYTQTILSIKSLWPDQSIYTFQFAKQLKNTLH